MTPRSFSAFRILPTTDVDTSHPRSLNSTASLSLPHLGLSSLISSTARASSLPQVGRLTLRGR